MITSLTPEQEQKFEFYRNKWIAIGKSCEPANFEECKKYARLAYAAAGLTCPEEFYLVDSPVAAIELDIKLRGNDIKQLDQKTANMMANDCLSNQIFGYHEAGWLSYYDYIWNELGIEDCGKLEGLIGIAQHCGWWSPYDTCVIFQHRHCELHTDSEHRLHNENGPAVRYRDGYSIWAINGVVVDEQTIMAPETLTAEKINNTSNLEARAIMIERLSWTNYLKKANATCIDSRYNEIEGTKEALYVSPLNNDHRLVATCTTGRIFTMGVPPTITTCEEAQAWLGPQHLRGGRKLNVIGRT